MFERLSQRLTRGVLFWDLLFTLASLFFSTHIRLWFEVGKNLTEQSTQLPLEIYLVATLTWGLTFLLLTPQRAIFASSLLEAIGRLMGAIGLASMAFAGLLYFTLREVSRLQFLYFVGTDLLFLLCFHLIVRASLSQRFQHRQQRRVLVVGEQTIGQQLAEEFLLRPWVGLLVVGYTSDEQAAVTSLPWLGKVAETAQIVAKQEIDEVIFALPPNQQAQVMHLYLQLQQYPVMVHMVPGLLDLAFARTPVDALGGIPLISLRESALTDAQRILKRLFDFSISLFLLLIFTPLLLLLALLIKLESPGSILFLQERIGEHGHHFRMIKFRSMYQDAEKRWQEVAKRDKDGNLIHKQTDDPRITRIGRFLRRTSLDELPQLLNVIYGEMSLVGPRPEIPYITAEYEPWQWQRFRVPPGITGWWQVNGRSDKPMHLHTEDDLYYIQNYSFWLDLRILLMTVLVVLRGQGAY